MVKKDPPAPRLRKSPTKSRRGRPAGDPLDVRTERLVLQIHMDLMTTIEQRAREGGMTRSAYVERILLQHANFVEGAELDMIGRRKPTMTVPKHRSLAAMGAEPLTLPNGKPGFRWRDPPMTDYEKERD